MPLPDLDVLVAIIDAESMTSAADKLGVPRATLSRRLARLEEEIGVRLIHRTTRQLAATEAGLELYRHSRTIVDAVETATAAVRSVDGVPRGLLRVTLPPGGGEVWGEVLSTFMVAHPKVRLEAMAVTRHVDLVAEGFDVGIRAGRLTGSSLISRRLAGARSVAVASPAYLALRGDPASVEELSNHDALVGFERGEIPLRTWPSRSGSLVPVNPRMASNDLTLLLSMTLQGHGIALLPEQFVESHLRRGELVPVLADQIGHEGGIWVVYPERRLMLPRVRAFIDHLVDWVRDHELFAADSER